MLLKPGECSEKFPFHSFDNMVPDPNGTASIYRCDGCKAFPITGTQYILEEDHDIDLCKTCFESRCTFAKKT
jgi:uncharacterized UBP type Zn finger protein